MPSAGRIVQPHRCTSLLVQIANRTKSRRNSAFHSSPIQLRSDRLRSHTNGAGLGNVSPCRGLASIPEMEPEMTNLKVLSMASAVALAVAVPSASFAQWKGGGGGRGAAVSVGGGGGGGFRA